MLKEVDAQYHTFGLEVGEQGTPHVQGFIVFARKCAMKTCKERLQLSRVHLEKMRGTHKQAAEYCQKSDPDYFVVGELPRQGERTDLIRMRDAIAEGERSMKRLRQEHPAAMARYGTFARQLLADYAPKPKCPDITLRPWQSEVIGLVRGEPKARTIHFYIDFAGNAGKSTFARYLMATFDHVQVLKPAKYPDMAYILDEEVRILVFDCPRSREENIRYDFLEDVKDGIVCSGKYESFNKCLGPVHVLVFCNFEPDKEKLSEDRFDRVYVNDQ